MSEALMIKNLYNLEETNAAEIFEGKTYPWEVLPEIKTFIITLGESLPLDKFDRREGHRNRRAFRHRNPAARYLRQERHLRL